MPLVTVFEVNITKTEQNSSIDKMMHVDVIVSVHICDVICENLSHVAKGETAK